MEERTDRLSLGRASFNWIGEDGVVVGEDIWSGNTYAEYALRPEGFRLGYDDFTSRDVIPPVLGKPLKICLMRDGDEMAEILPYRVFQEGDTVYIPA